jgi:phage repressor protein C with HTH and peptisase S24 domain
MSIGKRIEQIRLDNGLSQKEFSERIFKDKSSISKLESDKIELSPSMLRAICRTFNIREEWLKTGKGEKFPDKKEYPDANGLSDEFIFIRQMRGKISAGGGLEPDDTVDLRIAFRKDWITHKGTPENMSLIRVAGDSMIPTLLNGDLILVDHGKNYIASQGGIYAISVNHEIMIKRIQPIFPDGKLCVISDNKQYEPYEIESDKVKINGKVIWFARDMER